MVVLVVNKQTCRERIAHRGERRWLTNLVPRGRDASKVGGCTTSKKWLVRRPLLRVTSVRTAGACFVCALRSDQPLSNSLLLVLAPALRPAHTLGVAKCAPKRLSVQPHLLPLALLGPAPARLQRARHTTSAWALNFPSAAGRRCARPRSACPAQSTRTTSPSRAAPPSHVHPTTVRASSSSRLTMLTQGALAGIAVAGFVLLICLNCLLRPELRQATREFIALFRRTEPAAVAVRTAGLPHRGVHPAQRATRLKQAKAVRGIRIGLTASGVQMVAVVSTPQAMQLPAMSALPYSEPGLLAPQLPPVQAVPIAYVRSAAYEQSQPPPPYSEAAVDYALPPPYVEPITSFDEPHKPRETANTPV